MKRMKENYESRSKTFLVRRMPAILRIDGKAFHTYTRGLHRPFDEGLIEDMTQTAIYLCENIQGAKCAYTQSDEISILLTDYDKLQTNAWFDYNVQKMASVSASYATGKFLISRLTREAWKAKEYGGSESVADHLDDSDIKYFKLMEFDSRAFNIPKEEVANYFLARQKDAVKNSISMLAQSLWSHKELHKKNSSEMQEMCFQKGHNWNDLHWSKKRGTFVVKNEYWNDELVKTHESGFFKYTSNLMENNTFDFFSYQNSQEVILKSEVKIRTKWEAVETPMTFSQSDFKEWIT